MTKREGVIGARIRALREERCWSQSDLAEAMKQAGRQTNRETITRWETGVVEPTASSLKVLAAVLDVRMDYLTGAEGDPHTGNVKWNGTLQSLKDDEKILLSLYGELGEDEKRFLRRQIEALHRERERGDA